MLATLVSTADSTARFTEPTVHFSLSNSVRTIASGAESAGSNCMRLHRDAAKLFCSSSLPGRFANKSEQSEMSRFMSSMLTMSHGARCTPATLQHLQPLEA
eukprot:9199808-Pyramimonas_sp.AAC.1